MDTGHMASMLTTPRRVVGVRRETGDTVTLTLAAGDRFSFLPGQFNMLYAFAVGEVPVSMSGSAERADTIVHTVKAVGAVSAALCGLRPGAVLGVRGPFGRPWPVHETRGMDLLIVAGGLGLAPLRPVVYHVLDHRRDYGRVALLAGARTPGDLLFARELARWQKRARAALQVQATVDQAGEGWTGRVGVVTALIGEAKLDPARTAAFVCGPEVMMRFTVRELERVGLADERIHLSLERNMKCAVGFCGHCQYGPAFVCKDGPVFRLDQIRSLFWQREI